MRGTVLRLGACLAFGATLALAGCSRSTPGAPAPAGTGTPAPATSGTQSSPPALDAEPYRTKPCDLLPAALLKSLGYTAPGTVTAADKAVIAGNACSWNDYSGPKTRSIQVHIQRKITDPNFPGLTAIFNNYKKGLVAYADPTEVSGYQGVFADMVDERSSGKCDLSVAISDTQVLTASADGYSGAQDSCDTAKQLAQAMIKTLQGS
ncbi:DUF3558 domain-containing protein [Amycolatopsis alkalitolerans]|uniref:DUF3558 domain-containing protein n=1 Tax=Amycolatopsis alkalitolerans TaxID=2547244 RepID=A0A5C4LT04_9PSEU|nr:DUF3558 domain-containing protein [Amycolatopsis alkalitolerans]TNC21182.1 DUF3558 domain-containing protein [Amycolatopsis alkalitolerans]